MKQPNLKFLAKIEQAKQRLVDALEHGCLAYANGGEGPNGIAGGGDPIVDDRFKGAGNARFAPLSWDYAMRKAASAKKLRKLQKKEGHTVSKMIPVAYQSRTGVITGTSNNLPILVRTSRLRHAVKAGRARVIIAEDGTRGRIVFVGLPKYAEYHEGGDGVPARSPVKPNEADKARVVKSMRDFLRESLRVTPRK